MADARPRPSAPGDEQLFRRAAPDLAARRLGDGTRRCNEHLVRRNADGVDNARDDRVTKRVPGIHRLLPGLGDHHEPLCAATVIVDAKRRNTTATDARHVTDRFFNLLGI